MTDLFPNTVLMIFGVFFLFTGIMSFRQPVSFARSISLQAIGKSGCVEIRAQYGGFFFVAALSQVAPFVDLVSTFTAFVVALVIFGGLIIGRIGALFFDADGQTLTPMIRNLFWIDGMGTVLALVGVLLTQQGN